MLEEKFKKVLNIILSRVLPTKISRQTLNVETCTKLWLFIPKLIKLIGGVAVMSLSCKYMHNYFSYVFVPVILKLDVTIRLLFNQLFSQLSLIKLHLY